MQLGLRIQISTILTTQQLVLHMPLSSAKNKHAYNSHFSIRTHPLQRGIHLQLMSNNTLVHTFEKLRIVYGWK